MNQVIKTSVALSRSGVNHIIRGNKIIIQSKSGAEAFEELFVNKKKAEEWLKKKKKQGTKEIKFAGLTLKFVS